MRRSLRVMCAPPTEPGLVASAREAAPRLPSALGGTTKPPGRPKQSLIERLKDMRLQGHWAAAVGLFDNAPPQVRSGRWQAFHYRQVISLLLAARQGAPLERMWAAMKERPELAMDEPTANDALELAATVGAMPLVEDIVATMNDRSIEVRPRAKGRVDRLVASDWQVALSQATAKTHDEGVAVPGDFDRVAFRAPSPEAVRAVMAAMRAAGAPPDGNTYAALLRVSPSWTAALDVFTECEQRGVVPTSRTFDTLLRACARDRAFAARDGALDAMTQRRVPHTAMTMEHAVKRHHRAGEWREATAYFKTMRDLGVKPTSGAYTALVEMYHRQGRQELVAPALGLMRQDGVDSALVPGLQQSSRDVARAQRSAVSLINAWSSGRSKQFQGRR